MNAFSPFKIQSCFTDVFKFDAAHSHLFESCSIAKY